jgi:hypothetical protein
VATWRIASRDLVPASDHPVATRVTSLAVVAAVGLTAGILYVLMHAAS